MSLKSDGYAVIKRAVEKTNMRVTPEMGMR